MQITMMKSKIHRVTVTQSELDYEGSITIDSDLMKQANLRPHEQVHVFNVQNGNRFITYTIEGEAGSGVICINGPAARLTAVNDDVIVCSYAQMSEDEAENFQPHVLLMGENNKVKEVKRVSCQI